MIILANFKGVILPNFVSSKSDCISLSGIKEKVERFLLTCPTWEYQPVMKNEDGATIWWY